MVKNRRGYATLVLSGTFREGALQSKSPLNRTSSSDFRFDRFLARVEWILSRKAISRILIDYRADFAPRLYAGAEAVRRQLLRLRDAGKELHMVASELNELGLYLASVANYRYLHPTGSVALRGLAKSFTFARARLDREGIVPHVTRRGNYKSAGDFLRSSRLEDDTREEYQRYLDSVEDVLLTAIAEGYGRSLPELRELQKQPQLFDREAIDAGFCHDRKSKAEIEDQWRNEKWREHKARRLRHSIGRGKRVAVVVLEGSIAPGTSRRLPLMGQSLGSRSVVDTLRSLRKDKRVHAVVARVNSPGGSAVASDEMRHELSRLAEEKPLFVSMSEVAGSGGYWISTVGKKLFAEETTLTGSIGVITLTIDASQLLARAGLTGDAVRTADMADRGATYRAPSEAELAVAEQEVDQYYQAFLDIVARFRNTTPEMIDRIAQGRVWSGRDALKVGLVDAVGGLQDAIDAAREELGRRRVRLEYYPRTKLNLVERLIAGGVAAESGATTELASIAPARTALLLLRDAPRLFRKPLAVIPELWDFWHTG